MRKAVMNSRDDIMGHGNGGEGSTGSMQSGDLSPDHNSGSSSAMDNRGEDERKAPLAEDSTAMTINFLRARLLSERSVSKAARQKAQQLAKKVMELERQLEIVVEERKRAEKAIQEAFAALEHGGISKCSVSEAFDSGTVQDGATSGSKDTLGTREGTCFGPNSAGEEEEASTIGLLGNSGSEEQMLKCDMDETNRLHFHHMHRGLSWQTRGNSCVQIEKCPKKNLTQTLEQTHLHHVGVSDTESGSQRRIGKSCRQIKRRETRPVTEEQLRVVSACGEDETRGPTDSTSEEISHSGQKEWDFSSKIFEDTLEDDFEGSCYTGDEKAIRSSSSNEAPEEGDERDARSDPVGGQASREECTERVHSECIVSYPAEDQNRQIDSGSDANGSDKEMEMERVLEERAELIDRYEAEENAQREWEEKYRELNHASDQSMDCQKDERQEEEPEESNELEVVYLSSSKNSAATLNDERKEQTQMSDQSTSGNFSIQNIKKSVLSEAVELMNDKSQEATADETIEDMHGHVSASFCVSESATCKESPVEGLGNKNDNFVQAIAMENALEYKHRETQKNRIKQQEQKGILPSFVRNSVNRKDCSNIQSPATIEVVKSSENVEKHIIDVGLNLTEQPGPILEKHISDTIHENTVLAPLTHGVYEKVVGAIHGGEFADAGSIRLPAKDDIGRVPDGVQAGIKMENIRQAIQTSQLGKHMIGSKTGTRGYENSSGGSLMLREGEKLHGSEALHDISRGSLLRNPVEIMSDSVPREAQGTLKSWHGGNNDEQGVPMMQGIHHKQPLACITCDSMHHRVFDNPLRYMSDSVADVGQGELKSWHSSCSNEQEVCVMQGIHQKHTVADTWNGIHPGVSDKPLKYMPPFSTEHKQIQGQKNTEENFIASNFQSAGGTSHANMGTRSQDNQEGMAFGSQPDGSACLSESKMSPMGEFKSITATQRGGCFQTSWHGGSTSEHSIAGSSCVANTFSENMFSRIPYQHSYHDFSTNWIDPAFGSHENYVPARDSDQYLQRTLQIKGHEFQKANGVSETNHCSAKYKFPVSSQGHSKHIFSDQWTMPTPGNAGVSKRRDFQPLCSSVGENNRVENLYLFHMNQDRLRGRAQAVQPLLHHHQNHRFKDVLKALHLAKTQIQSTMHMTKPVGQHLNQAASFMQEHDTEKMIRSCNPLETPLNCAELFRLPSEVGHRPSSQIPASRPLLADCSHSILAGIPNSLSSSVNRRDRASLHIQHNENAEILSRQQSISVDNHGAQAKKSDAYNFSHNGKVQGPQQ